ncbi:MAG: hypothetical protein ACYTGZ_05205 [Planctomycetota bacterium]|jgi:hypothetical protein
MTFLRSVFYLAVSAALSWHFLLRPPLESPAEPTPIRRVELAVAPSVEPPPEESPEETSEALPPPPPPPPANEPEPPAETPSEPAPEELVEPEESAPPPPEAGTPEGDEEEEATEPVPEEKPEEKPEPAEDRIRREIENIASSEQMVSAASSELTGKTRRGFTTEFDTVTEHQFLIAQFYGERLLLIPRKGLDPRNHHYYVIDAARSDVVRRVNDVPPSNFRQVRDLLDPDIKYSALPAPLKSLRRKVTLASQIFLFAAPIPPREWAVVMARRAAALEACNDELGGKPRTLEDLRRVKMRYVALPGGGFDIQVKEFVFADGAHWRRKT